MCAARSALLSEAIGMHVRDINFERDRIQVNRGAVEVEGKIVVGAPKNWERRIVPFPEFLEAPLSRLCGGKGNRSGRVESS